MRPRIHETWGRADRPSILIALAFVSAAVFGLFLALSTDSTRPATADTASFGATADSQVQEDKPTNNYGTRANMDVKSQPTKLRRDFVAFDVSSIPAGSTVNSATLTLCLTRVTAGRVHEVRQVTQSWAETTITWNTQPTVSASLTDSITMPASVGCVSWTVTSDVQAWVDGAANNGWRVGDQDETTTGGNEKYRTREDTTVPAEQPRLDVDFVIAPTVTPTPPPTFTPTITPTPLPATATPTPTATATITPTPLPATATPTITPTPLPATATPTLTATATSTPTPLPPTATPTPTATATATSTATPTITPTPTPGKKTEMALSVKGGDCDDPVRPAKCSVPVGSEFILSVDVLNAPEDGYIYVQTFIDFGLNLTYKKAPAADEIVWPDSLDAVALQLEIFGPGLVFHGSATGLSSPFPLSFFEGNVVELLMNCTEGLSSTDVALLPFDDPVAGIGGAMFQDEFGQIFVPNVGSLTINCVDPDIALADTDGDGCTDLQELGLDEESGGQRDPNNPWDFYDTNGDRVVDLPNDILGVITAFNAYNVIYDRGPSTGPNPWNMTAPDGVIDLPNDILGVISQFQHSCV